MKAFFDQIHKVEDEILDEYLKAWQTYEVPKKTIMTCEGDVERYMYFVLEGVQKSYYLEKWEKRLSNAKVQRLECGHFVQEEQPDLVLTYSLDFLSN
jgi:hypothetical protein